VTRVTGASSQSKASAITLAAISAPTPDCRQPSSTVTMRPVFFTDSTIVAMSIGLSVRRSITSALILSFASSSAAANA